MVADSFVLWKITDPLKFIQTLSGSVANAESRINAVVYNSLKTVISSMKQEAVISGRDGELAAAIMENFEQNFDDYGLTVLAIETKRIDLPDENKAAVYERMISSAATSRHRMLPRETRRPSRSAASPTSLWRSRSRSKGAGRAHQSRGRGRIYARTVSGI